MNLPIILNTEAAMTILWRAATELEAIDAHCVISPLSLSQGMTMSLYVGADVQLTITADVAAGSGGEQACAAEKADEFASRVAYAIKDTARPETAGWPH